MATITKFEDLEISQLRRSRVNDFDKLVNETSLGKDYELRNQMNASSGSVMDCIAEGFERSGNNEFKNMLLRAQMVNTDLYRCLDRKHICSDRFNDLLNKNLTLGNRLMSFVSYLIKLTY